MAMKCRAPSRVLFLGNTNDAAARKMAVQSHGGLGGLGRKSWPDKGLAKPKTPARCAAVGFDRAFKANVENVEWRVMSRFNTRHST